MRRRVPYIEPKRTVYVGCEGKSEAGYAALLQEFAKERGVAVHLNIRTLSLGAGNPVVRVRKAAKEIDQIGRTLEKPTLRVLLLDRDQVDENPQMGQEAIALASKFGIQIVWQRPCFEALLLRHFPGQEKRRLGTSKLALQELERLWPGYVKGKSRVELREKVDWDGVRRVAGEEEEFRSFLLQLGFSL